MAGDYSRQSLSIANEEARAMVRGFTAMRKIQEQAGQQALINHSVVLDKLKQASDPAELMAVQAKLVSLDVESAARYWRELAAAAMEMQTEMLGCFTHLLDSESMLHAASAINGIPEWVVLSDFLVAKPDVAAHKAPAPTR